MPEERVRIEVSDGIADVAMVRSAKHNALDRAMFDALAAAPERLAADPSIRVVILRGEGKSFCSGLDIGGLYETGDSPETLMRRPEGQVANLAQRVAYDWSLVPAPVIAAVHGNCFGGGLQIALGADIRIAAPDARLSVMEVRWGLVPDMAITQTLPRLVGVDVAKELTFTGRILSGREADALGLVTRVAEDPVGAARDLAREILARSPDAVQAAKRLYDATWKSEDPAAALRLESELQSALIGSPNQIAAVQAGLSGQPGRFVDPAR